MTKMQNALCFFTLILSSALFAYTPPSPDFFKNVEVSAAIGPNWSRATSANLIVTPYETDSLLVTHVTSGLAGKIGVGYHFFAEQLSQRQFLNDLLVEINGYQSVGTIRGNVWQYQMPQFNNYNFNAPLTSTRLMLDLKPSLFTLKSVSLYPILGLGIAWNDVYYNENVTGAGIAARSAEALGSHTNNDFAYDLGVGLRLPVSARLSATLEYVYTSLGNVSPAGSPNGATLTSPPTFKVRNQSALLGLSWKLA